jgi:hypothetical protein
MPNLTLPCLLPCLLLQANEVASKKGTGAIATAIVQRCAGSDHRFVQCCMVFVLCCTVVGGWWLLHAARCNGEAVRRHRRQLAAH